MAETDAGASARTAGVRQVLVASLMFVALVVAVVGSLGAPLITSVATAFDVSLSSAQWTLTVTLLAGVIATPVLGLDAMVGPETDLVTAFAQPIPAQVICELLGVPYAARARFQGHALDLFRLDATPEEMMGAYQAVHGFIAELVQDKRDDPTDDLISGLTETDLTDEELVNIGFVLLGAGLDTTTNMLALGTYALLTHRDQIDVLHADPRNAVEELLRYLSIIPFTVRTALEDLELDGQQVKAGETVTVSVPAANRDRKHFADPDTLDLLREAGGHVAFGHGIHQCLGQQLARVELQVALPALFARFPNLRPAVPSQDIGMRTDMLIYGVHRLPVTWEA